MRINSRRIGKWLKYLFRYATKLLLILCLILILFPILLVLPPVKSRIIRSVNLKVSGLMQGEFRLENYTYVFPVGIALHDISYRDEFSEADITDLMVRLRKFSRRKNRIYSDLTISDADIFLSANTIAKLSSKEKNDSTAKNPESWVIRADLNLSQTSFVWSNSENIHVFSGGVQSSEINNVRVNLLQRSIEWGTIDIQGACASLIAGDNKKIPPEKRDNGWRFEGKAVAIGNSYFDLHILPDKLYLSSDINSINVKSSAINLLDKTIKVNGLEIDKLSHINLINPDTTEQSVKQNSSSKSFDWNIELKSGKLKGINFFHSMITEHYQDTVFSPAYLLITDFGTLIKQAQFSSDNIVFSAKELTLDFNDRIDLESGDVFLRSDSKGFTAKLNTLLNNTAIQCDLELAEGYKKLLRTKRVPAGKLNLDVENFIPSILNYFIPKAESLNSINDPVSCSVVVNVENDWAEIAECSISNDSLGKLSFQGAIDQINHPDSLMFSLTNTLSIRPSYFKTFLSDSAGVANFLPAELISIDGSIIGNGKSVHSKQQVLSDYIDLPLESSYFLSDSSFQVITEDIKIWADSLFGIPVKINSGYLEVMGSIRKDSRVTAKSTFSQIEILGRPYSDLRIVGNYQENMIDGTINSNDSSLEADLEIKLAVDTGINASVTGNLGFFADSITKEIHSLSLASGVNLSYRKPGESQFANVILPGLNATVNEANYGIDTLAIQLNENSSSTHLKIYSDILNGDFLCNTSMDSLLRWVKNSLGDIKSRDSTKFIDYITALPEFQLSTHLTKHPFVDEVVLKNRIEFEDLQFHFNSLENDEIRGALEITDLSSENIAIRNTDLKAEVKGDDLFIEADINGIERENLVTEDFHINSRIHKGLLHSQVKGSYNDKTQFLLSFEFEKDSSLYKLKFPDDSLVFAGSTWSFNRNNELRFTADTIFHANLELSRGEKRINLHNISSCPIQLSLENIDLKPIMAVFDPKNKFSGLVNSTVCFRKHNFSDVQSSFEILDLYVDGKKMGNYRLENSLSLKDKSVIQVAGNLFHESDEKIDISGTIYPKSWKNSTFELNLDEVSLKSVQLLAKEYFNEVDGTISGKLFFDGSSETLWNGRLKFNDMVINPKIVNNRLHFANNDLLFENRKIVLSRLPITDEQGKQMLIDGNVSFEDYKKPTTQLTVRTDSMQILNIPDRKTNPLYGKVIASNFLKVKGPLKSPNIDLDLRLIKGTDFTFRITENLESYEGEGVVYFTGLEESTEDQAATNFIFNAEKGGIDFNAKINIDPKSRLRLEYSENMDFDIALSGNGNITYKGNRSGKESMVGTYTVKEGEAVLKLQGLAPKQFTISPRSYLRWDGALDNPIVDIQAIYRVKGSYQNPASGMSNTIIVDYDVFFSFKNRLNNPEIVFDLETQDQYMTTVLNGMTEEERVKQAINVLLLGYIVTPETKGSGSKIITDHINQFWAQQLNSAADKSFKGVEVSFDVQSITNYSVGSAQDQTDISYEVKKDIWNDKATVKVGGYVRTYTSSPQDATTRLIGDFSLEYKLNKSENFYAKLFSENKYEGILEGEIQRTGVGLLYRQNYQSMSEIWEKRKQKRNEKKKSSKK